MEPTLKLPSGREIRYCKERLLRFVTWDAYKVYDYWGGYCQMPTSMVTERHVYATNVAMRARSSVNSWRVFTRDYTRDLADELDDIPHELDLIDSGLSEIWKGNDALKKVVAEIVRHSGLTDMAASKVLHLLRPKFVAISDTYVRAMLGIPPVPIASTQPKQRLFSQQVAEVQHRMRSLRFGNSATIETLYEWANSGITPLPAKSRQCKQDGIEAIPVILTKLRILDILLWTDVAIEVNPAWKTWYEQLGRE
ncbi:MAG: hypothetical protein HYX94_02290 [Chloroflexi bacterium]|nr:hypothetical protein [Chloroflexota bacterium]